METFQTLESTSPSLGLRNLDRLFDSARKATVIELRWLLVILCSYLLLYSPHPWLDSSQTHGLVIFYLLTNATLYFVADELFDSSYFYGPLLFFDTAVLAAALALSGAATPDFYVACSFTLILSCICNDTRGLVVVTLLSPLIYGYVTFSSAAALDPSFYLRLPFPLVIALFYGYFAQVERLKRVVKESQEQLKRQQKAAEEIRRQRERLEVLHDVNVAVTSTIDAKTILDSFVEKALIHLPYAAAIIQLRNPETKALETVAIKGVTLTEVDSADHPLTFVNRVVETGSPMRIGNLFVDRSVENCEFFRDQGLVSLIAMPLAANGHVLGSLSFLTREEHDFSEEEVGFLATLAGLVAIAIHHSELFGQIHQQAGELRHANKVKDEFLGVVSHELRTPLNVISGYTNMLIEGMMGEITPIQEKALQTVIRQSKELHHLINSLLEVSSIEARDLQAEMNEVNFWELFSELRAAYDYPLAKEIKLIWEVPSDLPILSSDRGRLKHILENLINNAIKFTDEGSVTISARYSNAKKTMEFKVADTGIGMSKDQLPFIFERFRQADSSDTRAFGGVGLGLYIVKRYTELLGGTVQAESKPGRGSTFTVRLPSQPGSLTSAHEQLSFPIEHQTLETSRV